jgi:hypothetical protein
MCAFILCLCCSVCGGDTPSKESEQMCEKDQGTEKAAMVEHRAVEPYICIDIDIAY